MRVLTLFKALPLGVGQARQRCPVTQGQRTRIVQFVGSLPKAVLPPDDVYRVEHDQTISNGLLRDAAPVVRARVGLGHLVGDRNRSAEHLHRQAHPGDAGRCVDWRKGTRRAVANSHRVMTARCPEVGILCRT